MVSRDRELVELGRHASSGMAQLEVVMAPSMRSYSSEACSLGSWGVQGASYYVTCIEGCEFDLLYKIRSCNFGGSSLLLLW